MPESMDRLAGRVRTRRGRLLLSAVGAATGAAVLLPAPAVNAVATRGDQCGITNHNCSGHHWLGSLSNGNGLQFVVDSRGGREAAFEVIRPASLLRGTRCTANGQAQTFRVPVAEQTSFPRVKDHRFSVTTEHPIPPPAPKVRWNVVGRISGKHAHGTFKWKIVAAQGSSCDPSKGTLSWKAKRGERVVFPG